MAVTQGQLVRSYHKGTNESIIENADQVEWKAFDRGSAVFESGIHDNIIAEDLESYDDEGFPDVDFDASPSPTTSRVPIDSPVWNYRSELEENAVASTAEEIARRQMVLGSLYPFEVKRNTLKLKKDTKHMLYEFLLAASVSTNFSKKPYNLIPLAFERLSKNILVHWLGTGAKGWQTGWPGRFKEGGGLPRELPELWERIHSETLEWEFQPTDVLPAEAEDSQKDLGIDVLAWKSFQDFRPFTLFLVGQCACGKDGVSGKKGNDVSTDFLKGWFRTTSLVKFVKTLLIPRCLGETTTAFRSVAGSLYFDRLRLILSSEGAEVKLLKTDGVDFEKIIRDVRNQAKR